MLITMGDMLRTAQKGGYAVPAPNVWNENSVRAALDTATELSSPIILDCSFMDFSFGDEAAQIMYEQMLYTVPWAKEASIPVAINLDHGMEFDHVICAIRNGFTSVMFDRSSASYEDNVGEVAEVVKIAHAAGVSVEAELGHVGDGDSYDATAHLTDPDQAVDYVERTGVDCLAIAIGSAHGAYSGTPHIDFERLEEIRRRVSIPLVLHGGSGTGDENLYKAARSGICKINLYTDLVTAGMEEVRKVDLAGNHDFSVVEEAAYQGYANKLAHYIKLFGSENKA